MLHKRRFFTYFIIYLTLALLSGLLLALYPFKAIMHPAKVTNYTQLSSMQEGDYVNLEIATLYYSGCDDISHKTVKGHYYYALTDNHCIYVLLKAHGKDKPQPTIQHVNLNCKLLQPTHIFETLNRTLAQQIGWTADHLKKISCPLIVSEPDYPHTSIYIFFVTLWILFTILCAFTIDSLFRFLIKKH